MPPSPTPLRRRVRVQQRTGDEVTFVTKSFTKDDGTLYHPVINEATGAFFCDCPDHLHRKSFCKHLRRAQSGLQRDSRRGEEELGDEENGLTPALPDSASRSMGSPELPVASPPPSTPAALVLSSTAPVVSPPLLFSSSPLLEPVASPPLLDSLSPLPERVAMPRFFANEHISQIIPAPASLRAQFADGCADEPVLCLALLSVPGGGAGNSKEPYQVVMPMVAYHGAIELACDIERPYLRLSSESR